MTPSCGVGGEGQVHDDGKILLASQCTDRLGDLREAVIHALELACIALAHVRGEARTREVEGVDDEQRSGTGRAAGGEVAREVAPELRLLVDALQEHGLVGVLEGEVQRLGGEVADHVRQVAAPEGHYALLRGDAAESVADALVALVLRDLLLVDILHLQHELHALDGRHDRLRDRACVGVKV